MTITSALTNLSAHKNCDKSVLHSNSEEIFNDWRSNETSKKFTRNMPTYTREKKILETRHFSKREKAVAEFSKEVRKLTCRQV